MRDLRLVVFALTNSRALPEADAIRLNLQNVGNLVAASWYLRSLSIGRDYSPSLYPLVLRN
jgi:hypothetical protein